MKYILNLILLVIFYSFSPNCIIGSEYVSIPFPKNTKSIVTHDSLPIAIFVIDNSNIIRSKTYLETYSLEKGNLLWREKLSYEEILRFSHIGILFCKKNSTTLRDYYSGEKLWKQNITIKTCSPHDSIAYATAPKLLWGDKLFKINLRTGEKTWESSYKYDYNSKWNLVSQQNDTTQIFISNNMLAINPIRGLIKELKLDRTYEQLDIITFIITGTAFFDSYRIGSNIVNENDSLFYVTDSKALRCIDRNLNVVWKTKLPFDYPLECSGASKLSQRGDTLELLNTGLILTHADTIKVSQPFVASFNKKTGEKLFKENYPERFNTDLYGKNIIYVLQPFYIYDPESKTYQLYKHTPLQHPVKVATGGIFIVDTKLGFIDKFTESDMYIPIARSNGYTILSHKVNKDPNSWKDFIIDPDGKMIEGTYTDNKIHFADHGKLYIEDGECLKPAPFSIEQ